MTNPARRIRAHSGRTFRPSTDDIGVIRQLVTNAEADTLRSRPLIAHRLAQHHARASHRDERRQPFLNVLARATVLQDRTPCVQRLRPGSIRHVPSVNRPDGREASEAEQPTVRKRTPPSGTIDARHEAAEIVGRHPAVRLKRTRDVAVPQHRGRIEVRQCTDSAFEIRRATQRQAAQAQPSNARRQHERQTPNGPRTSSVETALWGVS